jgi:DNA primase catalytic subunit|tara:strand:- start:60 stop:215 length:156 start_codon:yes stop_codon:yes gene_type:complete
MTKKKQKEKSWFDDHLIIDIDGVSKKEKEAIKQRIIERVVEKFDKQERKTK